MTGLTLTEPPKTLLSCGMRARRRMLLRNVACHQTLQPGGKVAVGGFEVAGVPRVGDVAVEAGVGHHHADLVLRIVGDDPSQHPDVRAVHADYDIEAVIVGPGDLAGLLAGIEPDAVAVQAALCRRIDRIANLFRQRFL